MGVFQETSVSRHYHAPDRRARIRQGAFDNQHLSVSDWCMGVMGWINFGIGMVGAVLISWSPVFLASLQAKYHGVRLRPGPVTYFRFYRNLSVAMKQFGISDGKPVLSPARREKYLRRTAAFLTENPHLLGPADLGLAGDLDPDQFPHDPVRLALSAVIYPYPQVAYGGFTPARLGLLTLMLARDGIPGVGEKDEPLVINAYRLLAVLLLRTVPEITEQDLAALSTVLLPADEQGDGDTGMSEHTRFALRELGREGGGLLTYEDILSMYALPSAVRQAVVDALIAGVRERREEWWGSEEEY